MPITTKVVSLNPVHGKVYLIQHYAIKFVSDLGQVGGFLWALRLPPPINWPPRYNWNIAGSGVKHHNPPQKISSTKTMPYTSSELTTHTLPVQTHSLWMFVIG